MRTPTGADARTGSLQGFNAFRHLSEGILDITLANFLYKIMQDSSRAVKIVRATPAHFIE
jgi:hypothetical protein